MDFKKEEEEISKKAELNKKVIDMILEIFGGDEDSPICFRLLKAEKKVHDKVFELQDKILETKKNKDLYDKNNSNLLPLISYFEQGSKLLEEIEKKIEEEDESEA